MLPVVYVRSHEMLILTGITESLSQKEKENRNIKTQLVQGKAVKKHIQNSCAHNHP